MICDQCWTAPGPIHKQLAKLTATQRQPLIHRETYTCSTGCSDPAQAAAAAASALLMQLLWNSSKTHAAN